MNDAASRLRDRLVEQVEAEPGRYLLRGQKQHYPTAMPLLHRASGELRGQAYTILRRLCGQARGQLFGPDLRGWVTASPDEALALMQHLGWPTPFIDLTDDVDVALFFACNGHDPRAGPAEIIVVDTEALPSGTRIVRHDEVIDPDLNVRWSRQRGYALLPPGWPGLFDEDADLLRMPGVETLPFQPDEELMAATRVRKAHYYTELPEISAQLRFLTRSIAEACEITPLHDELERFPF